jgi:hypothetical protein
MKRFTDALCLKWEQQEYKKNNPPLLQYHYVFLYLPLKI